MRSSTLEAPVPGEAQFPVFFRLRTLERLVNGKPDFEDDALLGQDLADRSGQKTVRPGQPKSTTQADLCSSKEIGIGHWCRKGEWSGNCQICVCPMDVIPKLRCDFEGWGEPREGLGPQPCF